MRGLHGVLTTALGLGTHIRCVAEHLRQRNFAGDLHSTRSSLLILHDAATGVEVTDNVAEVSSERYTTFMIGSMMTGSALRIASLNAMEPAILKAISEESTS